VSGRFSEPLECHVIPLVTVYARNILSSVLLEGDDKGLYAITYNGKQGYVGQCVAEQSGKNKETHGYKNE